MGDEMNPTENMPGVLPENYNQNQSFKSKDLEDWYNKKSRKINVHTFTTAENQIQPKYSIALVDWGIDQYCAYPEDLDSIGGTIILAGCSTYVHNLKDRTDENPDRIHEGLVDNTFNLDANGNQRPGVDNAEQSIAYLVNPDHITPSNCCCHWIWAGPILRVWERKWALKFQAASIIAVNHQVQTKSGSRKLE